MRLLLATNHLGLGGSESYLLTVAEQLDRLGHEVLLYTPEPDRGADVARERCIEVVDERALGEEFDAALVQDAGVSLQIADRRPRLPQAFIAHSAMFDLQSPPQLESVAGVVIVLNDRVEQRVRSLATRPEIVRMRQPVDPARFAPREALPETPRTALLLSNTPHADRLAMLEEACAGAGLELTQLGGREGQTLDPRPALAAADIVIGYGRSVLEAMAMGRAVYVYDWAGGDGWVTRESYPAIEANGFGGRNPDVIDRERLVSDLRRYEASMGPVNRDLVTANHAANPHTRELVGVIERLAEPPPRPPAPFQEMARLVRLEWRARSDVHALTHENAHLRGLLIDADRARQDAVGRLDAAERANGELRQAVAGYESSVSWRLTRPLRALRRALARAARRGGARRP